MVYVEPALPRGHKRPVGKPNRIMKPKGPKSHFGAKTMPLIKKSTKLRPNERLEAIEKEKEMEKVEMENAFKASNLVFGKVRSGMLLLGCVKYIRATQLLVSLPGRITGTVQISNISTAYSKRLKDMIDTDASDCPTLRDLYSVGDLVYAKVLIKKKERKLVDLSLNPSDLHSEIQPSQLVPGLVLSATITTKEDHGYTMDTGVRHVSAFLPQQNLKGNRDDVGRNLFCSIVSVTPSNAGAVVILKAFRPDEPRVLNVEEAALETIMPGCQLPFTVGEPVEFGLRGMLFEDSVTAYVNQNMLTKVTSKPEKYTMFKRLPATLLYVVPVTNEVFVSLRSYPNNRVESDHAYKLGSVIEKAVVKCTDAGGVWLQFDKKCRALLPLHIIRQTAEEESGGNVDESVLLSNFQVGTTHKVGVVYYDPLENTYIVSNSKNCVEQTIQSMDDIVIGQTYKCNVIKLSQSMGFTVGLGCVTGQANNVWVDQNCKVKPNDSVLLRAVSIGQQEGQFIRFTNQPLLLDESAPILKDWSQLDKARSDQSFIGVVTLRNRFAVWVSFFNNISGRLNLNDSIHDEAEVAKLRHGAIKLFTILDFDMATKQINLKVTNREELVQKAQLVNVTVRFVHATGVNVVEENGEKGTIPADCFSEFGEHNPLYMRLIREGETLPVVKTHTGTYSVRLTQYFQENPMNLQSVYAGMILKGSCVTSNGKVLVNPLLSNFAMRLRVGKGIRKIEDGSIIKMRVNFIDNLGYNGKSMMKVTTNLMDVTENVFDEAHSYMTEYLRDVNRLIERYRDQGHAFAQYCIGDRVECVVEGIVAEYNKLAVEICAIGKRSKYATKGIANIVLTELSASSYKVGQQIPGRVVWIDVERKLVQICVDKPLLDRIMVREEKDEEETVINKRCKVWVLFTNYYVNICCTQSGPPSPLVIVAAKHHYNDFFDNNISSNAVESHILKSIGSMDFAIGIKHYNEFEKMMNNKEEEAMKKETGFQQEKIKMVRCSTVPLSYDEQSGSSDDEDGEGEENSEKVNEHEDMEVNSDESDPEDAEIDDAQEYDDESNVETPPTNINTTNAGVMQKKKKNASLPLTKNGTKGAGKFVKLAKDTKSQKSTLRRKMAEEDSTGKQASVTSKEEKPLYKKKVSAVEESKKKKKVSSVEELKKQKPLQKGLKKTSKQFKIDQLDGASDLYLNQLDGTEDTRTETAVKRAGVAAKRRKDDSTNTKGLPGATNFWDSTPVFKRALSDSSDNEGDSGEEDRDETAPKKRATAKERFETMKQEEARLRKIEEELANPSVDPHTPDQFDRLVLAQPNNSMLWIRYMAFHMESAELEKARAVGRKALKAIHFREEAERLNVWIALLNLEIRYETVDSFKEVLQEAIQYNDAFKVYQRVVDILIDCQKHGEVQVLLELLLKKFRKQNDMWFLVADAWYRIGQGNKVKPLLSQALKSLPTREHIPLIIKFAFLHNRNENRDEAHLLFEQILTSYPKRTDIWSQYVDMLVKDNLVENARQILERAIMQRLPMKNMKTLYTKYVNFEEKHGDRERVRRVKQLAAEYVQAQLNNAGVNK
uniref:S1 motif domain-containing protein n=1 Tax=Anopheles christyi TaxID=43041 RepID=A0A182JRJ6_9DIPT